MNKSAFKVIVDEGKFEFELDADTLRQADVQQTGANTYHFIHEHHSFTVEIVEEDFLSRQYKILVNGASFELSIQDAYDIMVSKMGLGIVRQHKAREVRAPMPGLVLDIAVEAGQEIETGSPVLILEAMKMENVLKSEGPGVVAKILVEKGQAVEKGQLLIELE